MDFMEFLQRKESSETRTRTRAEITESARGLALDRSPELSSLAPANSSEPQSCSWPAPAPELLPAAAEHTSKRTWPAVAWHGTRRHGRSCHRPAPATHP